MIIYQIEWKRYENYEKGSIKKSSVKYIHSPFPNKTNNLDWWYTTKENIKVLQEIEKHPQFAILYLKSEGQDPCGSWPLYYLKRNGLLKRIISGKISLKLKLLIGSY